MDLNPAQRAAVEHDLGPVLVLSGAGSGKTRVVTSRIARLIERGVHARSILAMTFTNKAAEEMKERVAKMVGAKTAAELRVSTFHSFGMSVISAETKAFGLTSGRFTIFDQGDAAGTVREILRTVGGSRRYDVSAIMARIAHAKNALWEEADLPEREADEYDEIVKLVWPRYRAALKGFHAFDFDDLVCEPVRLWKRRPEVLSHWQARYRYLLIDEYQDTNRAQLEMVRLLAGEHKNVMAVGDDDQSIYAWRGADIANILEFDTHFPGAKIIKLEQNYRSTPPVLAVANAALARTEARRYAKVLRATRAGGTPVELVTAADPDVEAAFIADEIRALSGTVPLREMAILYRSNLLSEPLEGALRQRSIPFRLVGGTQFYERKEVKDLLAYVRVVLNPRDEIALRRVLNYPARQIGEAALERLEAASLSRGKSLWDIVEGADAIDGLSPQAKGGCREFTHVVATAKRALDAGIGSHELARTIADAVKLRDDVFAASASAPQAARRWGNVESLLSVFKRHDQKNGPGDARALADLVRFLTLKIEEDDEPADRAVTMTTMHGAKGLEFQVVFLAGLEEGLVPHARTLEGRATDVGGKADGDIEEERRLFYVSITRAKDRLYLCRARQRGLRGKLVARSPSRFLGDIPDELVKKRDVMAEAPPPLADAAARGAALLAALSGASGGGRSGR